MTAAGRVFSILLFAGLLLWPLAWIVLHGATLTGVNEESTGYRYFYTLRQLYDPPVFLFLAQGQLTNLIQKAIQVALTLLGFPATELLPRIDYFCYASVAAFHLMNVAAFAWLIDLISREYSVPLNQWKCRPAAKIGSQMIAVCEP